MEKIEYGDVNGFFVSMGLVLISLALVRPYFYLSEDFVLYIEANKAKQFSEAVQLMIFEKETTIGLIQKYLPWTESAGLRTLERTTPRVTGSVIAIATLL